MAGEGRVLVADDELAVRELLRAYLSKDGFTVIEADNGLDALSLLRQGRADIALVDVMMPGLDGFELIRRIRQESSVPILLLTARGEESSRVAGLELGADDYVVKPFSAPEVIARVRAHLRRLRGTLEGAETLSAGAVELDLKGRRCTAEGHEIELTRREFDLLARLMEHPGQALSREQLLETVWGSSYLSPKTVDVHVAQIRRKLGRTLTIIALRGIGYRLEA